MTEPAHDEKLAAMLPRMVLQGLGNRAIFRIDPPCLGLKAATTQTGLQPFGRIIPHRLLVQHGEDRHMGRPLEERPGIRHGARRGAASVPGDGYVVQRAGLAFLRQEDNRPPRAEDDGFDGVP